MRIQPLSIQRNDVEKSATRLVLIGGGHGHVQVVKAFNRAVCRANNIDVTLIDVQSKASYSGMVPACIDAQYQHSDTQVDLPALCSFAGSSFLNKGVVSIDPEKQVIRFDDDNIDSIEYDILSIDIGSTNKKNTPGVLEFATPTRPISSLVESIKTAEKTLLKSREITQDNNTNDSTFDLVVVGAGAAGVELAMSVQSRWESYLKLHQDDDDVSRSTNVSVMLLDSYSELLPNESEACRRKLMDILKNKRIVVRHKSIVKQITSHQIELEDGFSIAYNQCIWATGAQSHALNFNNIACDSKGWIRVNPKMQSVSHSNIFAVGDCCTIEGLSNGRASPPKAGVYAVRAGTLLIENLLTTCFNMNTNNNSDIVKVSSPQQQQSLSSFDPQDDFLKIIYCGNKKALAFKFGIPMYGTWVWNLKDFIDTSFMNLFRVKHIVESTSYNMEDNSYDDDIVDTSQYDDHFAINQNVGPEDAARLLLVEDDSLSPSLSWGIVRNMTESISFREKVIENLEGIAAADVSVPW